MSAPCLAVTLGDPAGIGPEIIAKAWRALRQTGPAFVAVGDGQSLAVAGAPIQRLGSAEGAAAAFARRLPVIDLALPAPVAPGRPTADAAPLVVRWIETAVGLALAGTVGAVVTAPIAKSVLYAGRFRHPGHTELLGELTAAAPVEGIRGPVMMLTAQDLKVCLATIHEPLARVPGLLSVERIVGVGLVAAQALRRDFGVAAPRLAVAGLNPHAGEEGALGREEIEIVAPAVQALRAQGVDAAGPLPADSLFHPTARAAYDAVLCLYHDQALIPVKMLDFWGGVNVTLGLPVVRTSPDHGVAFDIAGRGIARPDSLIAAIRLAGAIAARRAA
ncbi:MAG: 4-hydroxythreonine-4-phosphate dehydrogenase PdxA [Caulobacteraceae bacterium]|nr:4-hydroxythreonine-4-phosphate dehydrogenase PdxA [Caulobacteraceae bacterium]